MSPFELKESLHDVFKLYRVSGFMSDNFKYTINQFYKDGDPQLYINKVKSYVSEFNKGTGNEAYRPYIEAVQVVLSNGATETHVSSSTTESTSTKQAEPKDEPTNDTKTKSTSVESKSDDSIKTEASKPKESHQSKSVNDLNSSKNKTSQVDVSTSVKPERPNQTNRSSTKKKLDSISDLNTKLLKINAPASLMDILDEQIDFHSIQYLIGSGVLSDEERMSLRVSGQSKTIFRNHDFLLNRSELFIILCLLGLTYFNINFKMDVVRNLFDNNDLKIGFYEYLVELNLIELGIQADVERTKKSVAKIAAQNEQMNLMLSYLLLDRANVPKKQGRQVVKQYLDTASVLSQSVESVDVLDGILSSKLKTTKDYKQSKGS